MSIHDLIDAWRDKAKLLRDHALEPSARVYEICARELEDALHTQEQEPLTLSEAAALSGYSVDHLGRLVREGKIRNAGRTGAPRIKWSDVPSKAGQSAIGPQPRSEIVRRVLGKS